MARIFTRKQFSNYLGETRAINDIITSFIPTPDPSIRWNWLPPNTTNTGYTQTALSWFSEQPGTSGGRARFVLVNGPVLVPDYGGGVYFDGADDSGQFFKISPIEDFYPNTSIFTLSFWWEPHDTYVGYQRLVSTGQQKLEIACSNLNIAWYSPVNGWNTFSQTPNVINQPALFTMTYDGTTLKYYRNGILQDSNLATIDLSYPTGTTSIASLSFAADWYESTWYRINVYDEVKDADFILNYFNQTKSQYGY